MSQTIQRIVAPEKTQGRLPGQIAYIIGNEACERFSFYGMRNILTQFLVSSALLFTATEMVSQAEREAAAKEVFHTFVLGVYFFPLLGGYRFCGRGHLVADRPSAVGPSEGEDLARFSTSL